MAEFLMEGLDGGNPIGYLAALGVLRITDWAWPTRNACLHWTNGRGGWRPILSVRGQVDRDDWLSAVYEVLRDKNGQTAFSLSDDLKVPCASYKAAAARAAVLDDRREADFLAAFGSEAVELEENGKKTGNISDTALRTMSGAGHQHFLGSMRTLSTDTSLEHIFKTLFTPWQYDDPAENHVMRWDPLDDVRYALRWRNSSGDPDRRKGGAMWGANRLAIEALPLLPTAPVEGRLETTGFKKSKARGVVWSWPVWTVPVRLDMLRSVIALPELQKDEPRRHVLAAMGIAEVYRCQRITQGKYRNFTPAQPA